jgi:hypothetical protein
MDVTTKIDVKTIYDYAFASLRHASDIRVKIVGAWLAMYSAFAGGFVWVLVNARQYLWIVALAGALMTVAMWFAEYRNRVALGRAKAIGKHIENDPASGIPPELQFFSGLDEGIPHGTLINWFGGISLVLLVAGAVVLS